jgi:hypothetical protein
MSSRRLRLTPGSVSSTRAVPPERGPAAARTDPRPQLSCRRIGSLAERRRSPSRLMSRNRGEKTALGVPGVGGRAAPLPLPCRDGSLGVGARQSRNARLVGIPVVAVARRREPCKLVKARLLRRPLRYAQDRATQGAHPCSLVKPAKEGRCESPASANLQVSEIFGHGDQFAELAAGLATGDEQVVEP